MIIVLVTKGRHDEADYAKVKLFDERFQAEEYCLQVSTGKKKHWTKAEIVAEGEGVILGEPED